MLNGIYILLNIEDNPKTYREALASRNVVSWKKAINDEIDSVLSNNSYILVDLSQGSKSIRCDVSGHLEENIVHMGLYKPSRLDYSQEIHIEERHILFWYIYFDSKNNIYESFYNVSFNL